MIFIAIFLHILFLGVKMYRIVVFSDRASLQLCTEIVFQQRFLKYLAIRIPNLFLSQVPVLIKKTCSVRWGGQGKRVPIGGWGKKQLFFTSCAVKRSFSQYKSLLRDNRRSFKFENLKLYFVAYCYGSRNNQRMNNKR